MPTDETRRLLKVFGVAVTALEDAVEKSAPAEELSRAKTEVKNRLGEVQALLNRLSSKKE
ncbi:MAG: hypothetical protein ACE5HC_02510 [Candidatus Binatia bacterium]